MEPVSQAPPAGPRLWFEAARPRTLPASIVPVLVGTAASERAAMTFGGTPDHIPIQGVELLWGRFALALLVSLLLQVAVNFANDYFDGVKGVDTAARVGPRRVTAEGLVTPGQMRAAIAVTLGLAGVAGLVLALVVEPWLLLVGVAAGLATLGYSGGPRPYASAGLGEVFVFVFFGLVATLGSLFVQDQTVTAVGVVASAAVGLWSVSLLLVNNLRDIPTDREVGKMTLAVRIGDRATRWAYVACVLVAFLLVLALLPMTANAWVALPLLALPLAGPAIRVVLRAPTGPDLIAALGVTARSQLVFGVLLALGLATRESAFARAVELIP